MPRRRTKHLFSRHQDELIMGHARGTMDISIRQLRVLCGNVNSDTLERRAESLGVRLRKQVRNTTKVFRRDRNDTGTNPVIIDGRDMLLEKLQEIHGDRRYG